MLFPAKTRLGGFFFCLITFLWKQFVKLISKNFAYVGGTAGSRPAAGESQQVITETR
jgi:hypothetical protein